MEKLSRPVMGLMILVALSVTMAAGALAAVAWKKATRPAVVIASSSPSSAPANAAAAPVAPRPATPAPPADSAGRSAAATQRRTSIRRPPRGREEQPAAAPAAPQPAAEPQPDEPATEQEARAQAAAQAAEARAALAASPVGRLPVAARVRTLGLDEGQQAAIAQVDAVWSRIIEDRLAQHVEAVEAAREAQQAASDAGERVLVNQANAQMQEALRAQRAALNELNQQYLEQVRPYLNDEQARHLERMVNRGNDGPRRGPPTDEPQTEAGDEPPAPPPEQ